MKAELAVDLSLEPRRFRAGLIWASGLNTAKSDTLPAWIEALVERVRAAGEGYLSPERKAAVRDMLRFGNYKPAGRAKPSSEYLLSAALAGSFPAVNGPVDINNGLSLEYGYPGSIFDADKSGWELLLRRGAAGEAYVFNPSGQEITLHDLLCVCRRSEGGQWRPCGNPVKDAMETKIFEEARNVVAVVYAPVSDPVSVVEHCSARYAALLVSDCAAQYSGFCVI